MSKLKTIRPITATKKVNLLVYGIPGAGKTRFVGTGDNTLIIRPPTDHTDSIIPGKRKIEEVVVNTWTEMLEIQQYLREGGAQEYDWVWLDSISQMQDHGLDDIWDTLIIEKPHRAKYGLDKSEYGVNMFRLSQWVRHMVGAAMCNVGITAHPVESFTEQGELMYRPYIQGKNMSAKVCGYMNVVAYLAEEIVDEEDDSGETQRVLRTAKQDFYAKDQYDSLPGKKLINPTMPEFMRLVNAAKAKKAAAQPTKPTPTRTRVKVRRRTS